jgi:hypothetical protein
LAAARNHPTSRDNQDDHVKEVPELFRQAGTGT